ncbi:MAG: HAMP domain-containing protein, partial [Candidatus Omnitrophota bacterium]|nr:HAMP domain-containing protein [Candidatus Omnitrophota bacterium]
MRPQDWFRKLSLLPRPLRYKLMVAFSLMSVIPLLITGYLVTTYIFPTNTDIGNVSLIIAICVFIAILGLILAKGMIDPIAKLANHARILARGDFETSLLDIKREDEIGDLSISLNAITRRIKDNMEELRNYGEKTKEINLDIHKKVLALSSLLQIGNLISTKAKIEEILNLVTERIAQVLDAKISFFMMLNEAANQLEFKSAYQMDPAFVAIYKAKLGNTFLGEIADTGETFILDSKRQKQNFKGDPQFLSQIGVVNLLILPVTSHGKV